MSAPAAAQQTLKTTVELSKKYVRDGPHLWVSKILHTKGAISSNRIWEEFLKDPTVERKLINSKSYLKARVLYNMEL